MKKSTNEENNNVFTLIQLKLFKIFMHFNYDYGMSMIITNEEIETKDKFELLKLYVECDFDKYVYKIVISSDITAKEKKELINVYRDCKYDDGKLGMSLEEKLITMMSCVNYDRESYMFKIFTSNKLKTKRKTELKKQYEKKLQYTQ